MHETQQTVNAWQRETFGSHQDPIAIFRKLAIEFEELRETLDQYDHGDPGALTVPLGLELADVQIVLWQLAGAIGVDLDNYVAAKMARNRRRIWRFLGGGTAQHVEDDQQ